MSANLTAVFSAKDRISDKLNTMADSGEKTSSVFSKFGKTATVAFAAVGAAVAGAATKGVAEFAEFEGRMNEVFTLLPGVSEQSMGEMKEQVKAFSKEMGVLPNDVVPALYQAISASVPQDNVFSFLETAQKAAIGGISTVETAVDGLTTVVNAYGSDSMDVNRASDLMFTTVRLGKTNFEQLSTSMGQVLPSATAAGVSFEDVSASLSTLTAKGIGTAEASTKIRAAIDELAKPGTKVSDLFKDLAQKDFRTFVAEGGNVAEALDILGKHADESGMKIGDLFSSVEASSAATFLTKDDMFKEHLKQMGNAAGATDAAYKKMDQGLKRTWERIKANASVSLLEIGDMLAPYIQKVADGVMAAIPYIQKGLEGILKAVGFIFGKVGKLVGGFVDDVKEGLKPFVQVGRDSAKSFKESLALAIEDPSDLNEAFQGFKETVVNNIFKAFPPEMAEQLSDTFVNVFDKILDAADVVIFDIMPRLQQLGEIGIEGGKSFLEGIKNAFQDPSDLIEAFQGFKETMTNGFYNMFPEGQAQVISDWFTNVFDGALTVIQTFIDTISELVPAMMETFTPLSEGIMNVIQTISDDVLSLVEVFANFYMETIAPFVEQIVSAFTTYFLPTIQSVFDFLSETIFPIFTDALDYISNTAIPAILDVASEVFPHIASIIESAFMLIQGIWENILRPVLEGLVEGFRMGFSFIWGILESFIKNVTNVVESLIRIFDGIISFITGVFTGNWTKAWQGVVDIFGGIFDGIVALAKTPINTVIGLVNGAIGAINSIKVPKWVPGIGGSSTNIGKIPLLADGTDYWKGGDAIVGEAGAELVMGPKFGDLPTGSKVIPNDETREILSGTTSQETVQHNDNRQFMINLPNGDVLRSENKEDFKTKIIRILEEILDEENDVGGDMAIDF